MTDRRVRPYATDDYLQRLDRLTDDLERHILDNGHKHTQYESWITDIRKQMDNIEHQQTIISNDVQKLSEHKILLHEIKKEREGRERLLYSLKEKVMGSTILAVLMFIMGATGAAIIAWIKAHITK